MVDSFHQHLISSDIYLYFSSSFKPVSLSRCTHLTGMRGSSVVDLMYCPVRRGRGSANAMGCVGTKSLVTPTADDGSTGPDRPGSDRPQQQPKYAVDDTAEGKLRAEINELTTKMDEMNKQSHDAIAQKTSEVGALRVKELALILRITELEGRVLQLEDSVRDSAKTIDALRSANAAGLAIDHDQLMARHAAENRTAAQRISWLEDENKALQHRLEHVLTSMSSAQFGAVPFLSQTDSNPLAWNVSQSLSRAVTGSPAPHPPPLPPPGLIRQSSSTDSTGRPTVRGGPTNGVETIPARTFGSEEEEEQNVRKRLMQTATAAGLATPTDTTTTTTSLASQPHAHSHFSSTQPLPSPLPPQLNRPDSTASGTSSAVFGDAALAQTPSSAGDTSGTSSIRLGGLSVMGSASVLHSDNIYSSASVWSSTESHKSASPPAPVAALN